VTIRYDGLRDIFLTNTCVSDVCIGNEGTNVERFYRAAALVFWRRCDDEQLAVSLDVHSAIEHLCATYNHPWISHMTSTSTTGTTGAATTNGNGATTATSPSIPSGASKILETLASSTPPAGMLAHSRYMCDMMLMIEYVSVSVSLQRVINTGTNNTQSKHKSLLHLVNPNHHHHLILSSLLLIIRCLTRKLHGWHVQN
jgi:hypothetical protein